MWLVSTELKSRAVILILRLGHLILFHLKNEEKAMENDKGMISKGEALRQIRMALRRLALLHYYFAKTLLNELGEKQGIELIRKAVDAYGAHVGRDAKHKAEERGVGLTPKSFKSDLPNRPWETEIVVVDGEERTRVHHCPLAKEWLDMGESKIGRLYCFVDQAKMRAFNPDYEYVHSKNLLDGDPYCELVVRPAKRKTCTHERSK